MASQVYFQGNFYYASEKTDAGESPASHPDKWRLVELPAVLVDPVSQSAYARLLAGEGQADKRIVEMRNAQSILREYIRRDQTQGENDVRRADYDDFYAALAMLLGWDPDNSSSNEWHLGRRAINLALRQCWEAWWWAAVMQCDRLALRDEYSSATTYAAGDEVYWSVADGYYVATKAITAQDPATESAGVWTANTTEGWAELATSYSADDYVATTAYVVGDTVDYAGAVYQCVSNVTGTAPPDTDYWYELPEFKQYIPAGMVGRPVIGGIRKIGTSDPLLVPDTDSFEWRHYKDGFRILGLTTNRPWVWYRVMCPRLIGEAWDSATRYEAEELLEAVWGKSGIEDEAQPSPNYWHYADRTDLTADGAVPTADYDETA